MQVEHGESLVTTEHIQQVIDNCRTFTDFIKEGLIEYLDVNEENDSMMALYETGRTHFLWHPALQQTATRRSTVARIATHCNTTAGMAVKQTTRWPPCTEQLKLICMTLSTATQCNTLQRTATQYNTLQHTATHRNTLQHAATQYLDVDEENEFMGILYQTQRTLIYTQFTL